MRLLMLLLLISFFFACHADHRHLHSFPTRRSSDLALAIVGGLTALDGFFQALGFLTWKKPRSEEHTSELQSHVNLVCRLLLEKKNVRRFPVKDVFSAEYSSTMCNIALCDSYAYAHS